MTRRVYTYPSEMGWASANLLATMGAFVIALGGVLFIINVLRSHRSSVVSGSDPWEAGTLEWGAASPPENYNFELQPVVTGRYPLWEPPEKHAAVTGMREDRREVLVTSVMDAVPQFRMMLPGPNVWPFLTALGFGIGLAGSVVWFSWYFVAASLGMFGLIGWFWPHKPREVEP
jgi:cytochrome c oxidase subunit 1